MIRKVLIGASFALGNLNASSRRLATLSSSRLISNLTDSEKVDYSTPVVSAETTHRRLLLDMENIINMPEIDLQSCMQFLKISTQFYKQSNINYLKELHNESSFKLFCDILCDKTARISSSEATFILVRLCKLQINRINPLIVMRFWHRHIDTNVKHLSFIQIEMLLIHVLEHLSNTPWTESKKFALVRRLRRKILTEELKKLSLISIISALNLMHAFKIVDVRASEIFFKSLASQKSPDWLQIFRILGSLDCLLPGYKPLMETARKNIFQNIMDLPLQNLISILLCIKDKLWQGHHEFYDAKFVDAIVDRAVWDDCDLETGIVILNALSSMGHKHIPFLNYLIKKYEDRDNPRHVKTLVTLFSYAVKVNCEQIACILLEKLMNEQQTIKSSKKLLVNVTYYMAVLDHYNQDLLQTLFSNIDYAFVNRVFKLRRLISMVKIFCPSYTIPRLLKNEECIEARASDKINVENNSEQREVDKRSDKIFPLKSKLELIFGGPMYLLTNVKVKFRLPVDHAVIFRQGGYPVAVNLDIKSSDNDEILLNRIPVPPDSHTVLITSVPWHGFVLNTGEITGTFRSFVKCLKELNYNIVLVNQVEWKKTPDSEKIPWLMRRIRERCKYIYEDVV